MSGMSSGMAAPSPAAALREAKSARLELWGWPTVWERSSGALLSSNMGRSGGAAALPALWIRSAPPPLCVGHMMPQRFCSEKPRCPLAQESHACDAEFLKGDLAADGCYWGIRSAYVTPTTLALMRMRGTAHELHA